MQVRDDLRGEVAAGMAEDRRERGCCGQDLDREHLPTRMTPAQDPNLVEFFEWTPLDRAHVHRPKLRGNSRLVYIVVRILISTGRLVTN